MGMGAERAYARHPRQESKLRFGLLACGALGLPNVLLNFIMDLGEISEGGETLIFIVSAVWILLFSLMICLSSSGAVCRRIGAVRLEILLSMSMTLAMPSWALSCPCIADQLVGESDPSTCHSDSRLILGIDALVTVQHMLIGVRWCVMWPPEFAAILTYMIPTAIFGSTEGADTPMLVCLLCVLVIGSSIGRRTIEQHERLQFLDLIEEKTRRVEAEHQLEFQPDLQSADCVNGAQPCLDELESVPQTTSTGLVFDTFQQEVEPMAPLTELMQRGLREHWLVDARELTIRRDQVMGSGSFGLVVAGALNGTPVAVKVPKRARNRTEGQLRDITNELRVLRKIYHPNIVGFHGAAINAQYGELVLLLEMLDGPTLEIFIASQSRSRLDSVLALEPERMKQQTESWQCLVGICRALLYLHTRKPHVVHGDLKATNILVDLLQSGPRPKLLDFGLSRIVTKNAVPLGGTLRWAAPEVVNNSEKKPHPSADVFSFGRLAYFITTKQKPLAGLSEKSIRQFSKNGGIPLLEWPSGDAMMERGVDLVQWCSESNPQNRCSASDIHDMLCAWPDFNDGRSGEDEGVEVSTDTNGTDLSIWEHIQMLRVKRNRRLAKMPAFRLFQRRFFSNSQSPEPPEEPVCECTQLRDCSDLAFPTLPVTPSSTLALQILGIVAHNNFQRPEPLGCCKFHESLAVMKAACQELGSGRCQHDIYSKVNARCASCGLLAYVEAGDSSAQCYFCDAKVSLHAGRSSPQSRASSGETSCVDSSLEASCASRPSLPTLSL